jgi:hypothetical protein
MSEAASLWTTLLAAAAAFIGMVLALEWVAQARHEYWDHRRRLVLRRAHRALAIAVLGAVVALIVSVRGIADLRLAHAQALARADKAESDLARFESALQKRVEGLRAPPAPAAAPQEPVVRNDSPATQARTATVATRGAALVVRAQPAGATVGHLAHGTTIELLAEPPREANGRIWLAVRSPQASGWTVQDYLTVP